MHDGNVARVTVLLQREHHCSKSTPKTLIPMLGSPLVGPNHNLGIFDFVILVTGGSFRWRYPIDEIGSWKAGTSPSQFSSKHVWSLMEIKAPLRRISFKYQLGQLREHEQRSSRMYSTDSSKSYGLKQIRGGPLSMIHVGNKELSP
nr:hypothetical protein CFP56_19079 [Quercus suber]